MKTLITMTSQMRLAMTLSVCALAIIGSAIGCSPDSPKLVEPPVGVKERVKNTGGTKVSFNRSVDILFVVDDSGSMEQHQTNLAANVKLFTQSIINNQVLDYHIGVLTSTMDGTASSGRAGYGSEGRLNGITKFITRTTPNGAADLEYNLQPGTEGSGGETFFTPVQAALTPPLVQSYNAGFYRPDAYLVVIFLTDSDDQSRLSAPDFHKFLVSLKGGDPSKIITYGAHIPSTDKTCNRSGEPSPKKLEEFFKLTNAKVLGLCEPDFGVKLADLGADLVSKVGSVLYLTRPAMPDTISVTFGSQTIPNDPVTGWIYDPARNALVFGEEIDLKPEPLGTQVEVDFTAAQY